MKRTPSDIFMFNYTKFLFCVFGRGRAAERKLWRRRSEAKKATAGTRQSLTEAKRGQRHDLILSGRLPARRAYPKAYGANRLQTEASVSRRRRRTSAEQARSLPELCEQGRQSRRASARGVAKRRGAKGRAERAPST